MRGREGKESASAANLVCRAMNESVTYTAERVLWRGVRRQHQPCVGAMRRQRAELARCASALAGNERAVLDLEYE